jgi:hypothetical protein
MGILWMIALGVFVMLTWTPVSTPKVSGMLPPMQVGKTRSLQSPDASAWTTRVRRTAVANGPLTFGNKSSTNGSLEKYGITRICPCDQVIYDGNGPGPILDGNGPGPTLDGNGNIPVLDANGPGPYTILDANGPGPYIILDSN